MPLHTPPGPCLHASQLLKVTENASVMSQALCCQLCQRHPDCKTSVLAANFQPGQSQCLLKSGCDQPTENRARVRCCQTYDDSCIRPPPPPPAAWSCREDLLPVFCDSTKSPDLRIAELVANLTVDEKIAQIGANGAPRVDRLGIPAYQWWGEALHGICKSPSVSFRDPTPVGTSFPEPILIGATFDPELFSAVGKVVGREGRAMANAGNAGLDFWAPNINIVRDPRWGRLQETPGEDPFLTSRYGNFSFTTMIDHPPPPIRHVVSSTFVSMQIGC